MPPPAKGFKRLNVDVSEELWRKAKQRALDTNSDLRRIVTEALEVALAKPIKKGGRS